MKKFMLPVLMLSTVMSASISNCLAMDYSEEKEISKSSKMGSTELLYLNDTYLMEERSKITDIGKDNRGVYVVFDKTIFYPQGGGQPSDLGEITVNERNHKVSHVSFLDGRVLHYVGQDLEAIKSVVLEGMDVTMNVNLDNRLTNAKAHTAGHLLDAVSREIAPEIVGMKGYHFPDGPYVEFEGALTSMKPEVFIENVNQLMEKSIGSDLKIKTSNVESDFLNTLRLPTGFKVPSGKQHRIVQIDGFQPVPCGGTHLKSLLELKEVKIRKVNVKKGVTKVGYSFL